MVEAYSANDVSQILHVARFMWMTMNNNNAEVQLYLLSLLHKHKYEIFFR